MEGVQMQSTRPVKIRAVIHAGLLESVFASEEIDFEYVDADEYEGDIGAVVAEYSQLPVEVM
jgi:hypothetical protein